MSEWSFSVGEGGGKRLQTAGKYLDRDIKVNLDEAIPEEVNAQSGLLDQAISMLEGKAAGGGGGTNTRLKDLVEGTLTELDDDSITSTCSYAFYKMDNLVRVNLPNLTSLGSYTFTDCVSLVSVNLPNLTSAVATFTFDGCSALKQVNFPNATAANNYSFQDCASLEKVEFGVATSIGSFAFQRTGVKALIIRNNTSKLTKLNATNAFSGCPIADGTGYIYFPREYVDSYKAATGWSTYADQIRALEDYTVDGTVTGALDESKI